MTIAAGHGLQPILTAGKDKPLTVVASMILFPILLIMSLDSRAKKEAMASATLWNVQMSRIAVSLIERMILVSGLVTQLSADVTSFLENQLA